MEYVSIGLWLLTFLVIFFYLNLIFRRYEEREWDRKRNDILENGSLCLLYLLLFIRIGFVCMGY